MFVAVTGPTLHVHFSFRLGLFCGFCYICGDVLGRSLDVLHVLVTTWSILTITAANRCKAFEASTSQLLRRLLRSCFLFWDILSFAESILAKEPSSPIPVPYRTTSWRCYLRRTSAYSPAQVGRYTGNYIPKNLYLSLCQADPLKVPTTRPVSLQVQVLVHHPTLRNHA